MEASSIGAYVFPSELGWMAVTWTNDRLTRLTFGHPSAAAAAADLRLADDAAVNRENDLPGWVADLVDGLQNYAAGGDVSFDNVPLSLDHLSEFQRRIVKACRRIGRGRVRTYGELAAASGSPAAARAAGNVMAQKANPALAALSCRAHAAHIRRGCRGMSPGERLSTRSPFPAASSALRTAAGSGRWRNARARLR
jgi:methylated-DNA-[protein]-cysteine S-methyltransferase